MRMWRGMSFGLLLLLGTPVSTFATTILLDPADAAIQDILSVSGSFHATTLYLSATFRSGTFVPGNLGFLFGLDTDLNPLTGVQPPATFPLGSDFNVFGLASGGNPPSVASVIRIGVGFQGTVPVVFGTDAFSLAIPLALLGNDDGVANFGLAVGTPNSPSGFLLTDQTSGPLSGPTTAVPIPEPGTLTLLSVGLLGFTTLRNGKGRKILKDSVR
jgi:PEP-CTERM motif-containing protein